MSHCPGCNGHFLPMEPSMADPNCPGCGHEQEIADLQRQLDAMREALKSFTTMRTDSREFVSVFTAAVMRANQVIAQDQP